MASLKELAERWHRMLRGEASVAETASELGADPARLAIYHDFVAGHVDGVLDKNFVYLQRLLSAELWRELKADYYRSRPSGHWELNQAAAGFAEFLAGQVAGRAGLDGFHVVVAELEWEQFVAYMHVAEIPAPAQVQGCAVNPTLSVLELPYDVPRFLADHGLDGLHPEMMLPPRLDEPVLALVYRDPADSSSRVEAATPELLAAVKIAADGMSVDDAAGQLGVTVEAVTALLADAAERGLIVCPPT